MVSCSLGSQTSAEQVDRPETPQSFYRPYYSVHCNSTKQDELIHMNLLNESGSSVFKYGVGSLFF